MKKLSALHICWFVGLIIINIGVLIAVYILNGLSALGPASGIFNSTIGNQSNKYYLDITPAGWTFSIWGVIYAWQALWVLYSVANLFRKTPQGPGYLSPPVLPPVLFFLYIIANCMNIAWLFSFDRDCILTAFLALFLITVFLVTSLAASYMGLERVISVLVNEGRTGDIWLVRGLVQNGLAIYGTWTSIATLLNLAMVITYSDGSVVSIATAGTIALAILMTEIVIFVLTDLLFLDRYSRYTFTPYIVFVFALIGSIAKNWNPWATNTVLSLILLVLGALALVVKLIVSVYRHMTRSPYSSHLEGYERARMLA